MHTFTYTPDPNNPYDHVKSVVETNAENIDDVLDAVKRHLLAAGFFVQGEIEVVDEETGERKE